VIRKFFGLDQITIKVQFSENNNTKQHVSTLCVVRAFWRLWARN